MNTSEIGQLLAEKFGSENISCKEGVGDPYLETNLEKIVEILTFLRDEPRALFDELNAISGVDYPDKKIIAVVYHLFSYTYLHSLNIKVLLSRENPSIRTVEGIWKAANWQERELFDIFGVQIEGHSDLRRILLPEDWEGYPLRKDYVHQEYYHGIKVGMDRMPPTRVT